MPDERPPAEDLMESLIRSFPTNLLAVSNVEDDMTAALRGRLAANFDLPVPMNWRVLSYEDNAAMGFNPASMLVADPGDTVYEVSATVRLREVRRG